MYFISFLILQLNKKNMNSWEDTRLSNKFLLLEVNKDQVYRIKNIYTCMQLKIKQLKQEARIKIVKQLKTNFNLFNSYTTNIYLNVYF